MSFRRYDKFLLRLCQLQPWFILFFKQNVFLNLEDNKGNRTHAVTELSHKRWKKNAILRRYLQKNQPGTKSEHLLMISSVGPQDGVHNSFCCAMLRISSGALNKCQNIDTQTN